MTAWIRVDTTGAAHPRQRWAAQNVIDPEPVITAKSPGTVIPPAETFFGLIELPEHVRQTLLNQALKGGAFLIAE